METESLFANKLKLIINNLRFSKIIYISEKHNERIFYSLSNNFDSIRIIKHINHIKDFVSKEDLIILEINELQFNQEILLEIAKLRTYHPTNLIILVGYGNNLEPNQFHGELMSYGFKNLFSQKLQNIFYDLYEYNIIDYKTKPEWLNSDYWANPELWKK